ncbi:hypothetical protein MLD38_030648 [Melastoma candidum]|uniref:Uncharacterized protein n=1 Tax=Melastoma candidum TaxID=119954 RepID=A0ACB9MQV6_9MYRT|nr:hypothetical protein MLD38_030648 [Melastoma candidum]
MLFSPPSTRFLSRIAPSFAHLTSPRLLSLGPASEFPQPSELSPASVCDLLSSYSNDWQKALDFFNWAEQSCRFPHSTDTYNRMIDILGKAFEFDRSWALIARMAAYRTRNPSSSPDHATFRIMFKRYLSARLVDDAMRAYDRCADFGLKDETCFYNLVDALCEYRHVVEAHEWCFGKEGIRVKGLGFRVDETKVCNLILRGWYKIQWWSKCREFWDQMDEMGVSKDLHSYSIYMDIMCKCGKPWKAVRLYKEMRRKRMKLDVVAYNTVVHAAGLSDGVDFSIRLCREMRELGCMPNVVTYNTVIKLLCDGGRVREAYEQLREMRKYGCKPDIMTYHCLFRSSEKPGEVMRLFDKMIASGIRPKMDTYVMLMRKFGRWGFLRPVLLLWEKMEELGASPDEFAYNALIDALIDKGMTELARKYDQEMLAKGLSPKPRAKLATDPAEGNPQQLLDSDG